MTFIVGSNKKLVWYWRVPRTAALRITEQQTDHATKNVDVEFELKSNIPKYASRAATATIVHNVLMAADGHCCGEASCAATAH